MSNTMVPAYELVGTLTREQAVAELLAGSSVLWDKGHTFPCDGIEIRPARPTLETGVARIPVLPISDEDEATVDALVKRRVQETEVAGCTAVTTNSKYRRLQRCPHGVHQDNRCRVCD